MRFSAHIRCRSLITASAIALTAMPAMAQEIQALPGDAVVTLDPQVVTNDTVPPGTGSTATGANYANSPAVLDTGITGVAQQIAFIQGSNTGASLGLCTGTLINPRTILTASHCLYSAPAAYYGSQTGVGGGTYGAVANAYGATNGIPLSFGFNATNRCLGVTVNGCASGTGAYEQWRDHGFTTQVALNIYNANQVWYGTNMQPTNLGGGGEFANKDIALVTLDTHVRNIPTWTLLFSPLEAPAHVTITGYGGTGVGLSGIGSAAGIDYRRRSAENMADALMTYREWAIQPAIYGPNYTGLTQYQHAIYWMDFDDPNWDPNNLPSNFFSNTAPAGGRNNGYYDFNGLGGPTGTALPLEGSTAGGDSGGPLIVDRQFDRNVVIAVLTGSISFNGGISTYGQFNVYSPLFPFWEEIVQNNPYVYASAKAGNGDWFDASHWVQDMDPNYVVIGADGQLINALPNTPQVGADGVTDRYGTVCFVNASCSELTGTASAPATGNSLVIAGGPGSTNFVPNNVEPVNSLTPGATVKARYYDVTLREAGKTTLSGTAQIDKLTMDGAAILDIKAGGSLGIWAEFNQVAGWTNIDGLLKSSESLIVSGLLTGTGTFDPTYLTVVAGIVAPGGGDKVGTLTVKGDVILSSASALFIDAQRGKADQLNIVGDGDNAGVLALNGGAVVFNKVTDTPAPRFGEKYEIVKTTAGIDGTFGTAYTFQGVLRPVLTYTDTSVWAEMRANSFTTVLGSSSPTATAFGKALDALRTGSYNNLYNLYGAVDWMGTEQLTATFESLAPRVVGDATALQERQSRMLTSTIGDRLSLLASGKADGLSVTGTPFAALNARQGVQAGKLGFGASATGATHFAALPGRMSGFLAGGIDRTRSSYASSTFGGQGGTYVAMGLEMPVGDKLVLGTAGGYAQGESTPGNDRNRTRTTLAAGYAAMPLGGGAYVGGMLSAEGITTSLDRLSNDGVSALRMSGATRARRYSANAEVGVEAALGGGLSLTPRAQLGYSRFDLDGFREEGGETALQLEDVRLNRFEGRIGAKLGGSIKLGSSTLTPAISADYVRVLAGRSLDATVRFAVAPDAAIDLPLGTSAAGYGEVKGGVTLEKAGWSFGLSGQSTVGGSALGDQRGQADFVLRF